MFIFFFFLVLLALGLALLFLDTGNHDIHLCLKYLMFIPLIFIQVLFLFFLIYFPLFLAPYGMYFPLLLAHYGMYFFSGEDFVMFRGVFEFDVEWLGLFPLRSVSGFFGYGYF